MDQPRLTTTFAPAIPRAVMVMLHGGQERNDQPVQDRHASWWRMAMMARALAPFAERHSFALVLVQYRKRGWNSPTDPDPVRDARFVLAQLAERYGQLPIVLVGHSMGGRTACHVADNPQVVGIVALAPWLPKGEPNRTIADKNLRVIHGTRDRWTSARWSKDYVQRAQSVAASATWQSMPGVGHFMLRRVRKWNQFVEESVLDIVGPTPKLGAPSEGTS